MKRKIIWILLITILVCTVPLKIFASTEIDDVVSDGDNFLNAAKSPDTVINTTELKNTSSDVYNIILAIGMVIDVIVGLIIGIKFMISSVEEKARIKEILVAYVIGSIVLFGAFTIWKITMQILGNV